MKWKRIIYAILICCVFQNSFLTVSAEEETEIVEDLDSIDESGTYFFEVYSYDENGKPFSEILKVTITYPNTILNREEREGIDAQDVKVEKGTITNLSNQELITLANAHAWDLDTGKLIEIETVTLSKVNDYSADYTIVFSTAKGTSIQVNAYEFEEVHLLLKNNTTKTSSIWNSYLRSLSVVLILLIVIPIILVIISFINAVRKARQVNDTLYNE